MLQTLINITYVLVAIAMIALILMQRGAGAAAGSGFGAGASATVFGARGSANFLSKSTAVLATMFFVLSLGMAVSASRLANKGPAADDLGVMGSLPVQGTAPAVAPASEVPAIDVPASGAADSAEVPVEGAASAPVESTDNVEEDGNK